MTWRSAATIVFTMCLFGCGPTATQMEVTQTVDALKAVSLNYRDCQNRAGYDAAHAEIAKQMPITIPVTVTLEQKLNKKKPTSKEVAELLDWHKDIQECRSTILANLPPNVDWFSQVMTENYLANDTIYLRLAKQEISWGDANQQLEQNRITTGARLKQQVGQWGAAEQAKINQEVAERQAVWAALAAAAANVPTTTTCKSSRNSVSCTTW